MRVPNATYHAHRWVIEQIAPDFDLLDAWALPIEGERDDRDAALELMETLDPTKSESALSRFLFAVRLFLGRIFHWDDEKEARAIPGCTETTLRARLPNELRGSADGITTGSTLRSVAGGFVPLYRTANEAALELSNATVHGVAHLAWVEEGSGRYRAYLGVYVKPRGALGATYLKFISPFRHLIVYPALMRQVRRAWEKEKMRA